MQKITDKLPYNPIGEFRLEGTVIVGMLAKHTTPPQKMGEEAQQGEPNRGQRLTNPTPHLGPERPKEKGAWLQGAGIKELPATAGQLRPCCNQPHCPERAERCADTTMQFMMNVICMTDHHVHSLIYAPKVKLGRRTHLTLLAWPSFRDGGRGSGGSKLHKLTRDWN